MAQNSRRPFIPQITSTGGGGETIFFSSILDRHESHDDVDTALKLSNSLYSTQPLQFNTPEGGDGVDLSLGLGHGDNDANTTLELCSSAIYNPTPKEGDVLKLGPPGAVGMERKRCRDWDHDDDEDVVPSIEEYPKVREAVVSLYGSRPFFLYRKKLEGSDVRADQNTLVLTNGEPLIQFFNKAEVEAVNRNAQGLTRIVGVDQRGRMYDLGLKMWPSYNIRVINSDWNKMVAANNAKKGDIVLIWGFRCQRGGLGLAVVFRKLSRATSDFRH